MHRAIFILICTILSGAQSISFENNKILLESLAEEKTYVIATTWDNDTLPENERVTVKLSASKEGHGNEEQLVISMEAPFYDDPHIPDDTPPETMWELWEYEVVEVFFLGPNDHYLELEFSPKGQYILLEFRGSRAVIRDKLPLYKNDYVANINNTTNRWTGRAVIPNCYLPPNIEKFNAYAIHGNGTERVYKSLFPTRKGEFQDPDFHKLTHFGPIDFGTILPGMTTTTPMTTTTNDGSRPRSLAFVNSAIAFVLVLACQILNFNFLK